MIIIDHIEKLERLTFSNLSVINEFEKCPLHENQLFPLSKDCFSM